MSHTQNPSSWPYSGLPFSLVDLFSSPPTINIPRPPTPRDPFEGLCFDEFEPPAESHGDSPSPLSLHPISPLANPEPVIPGLGLETIESFPTSTPGPDSTSHITASTLETTHPDMAEGICTEGGQCAQLKPVDYSPKHPGCTTRLNSVEGKEPQTASHQGSD